MADSPSPAPYDPLRDVLAKLVPESGSMTITTADGKPVTLTTTLPARRQIEVARIVERMFRRNVATGTIEALRAGKSPDLFAQIVRGINDDDSITDLGRAFTAAYPSACSGDPLDVFPIEEVVLALLPLLVRPILRGLDVVGPLGSLAETPEP